MNAGCNVLGVLLHEGLTSDVLVQLDVAFADAVHDFAHDWR